MFCCGVGLTMMGSPVQASDDNNKNNVVVTNSESISSTNGSMGVVLEKPNNTELHIRLGLKHKCNKKVDVSKLPTPEGVTFSQVKNRDQLKKAKKVPFSPTGKIGHINSEPWKPTFPLVDR